MLQHHLACSKTPTRPPFSAIRKIAPRAVAVQYSLSTMAAEIVPRFLLPRLSWAAQISTSQAARPLSWTIPQGGTAAARWHHSATMTTVNARGSSFPLRWALQKSPVLSRTFHATARRERDHHFDTLKFVKRLHDEGFTEEQSVAMMKVLNDVIQERYVCVTGIM